MKVLYVINAFENKFVYFHAVQITKENEIEFTTLDKINITDKEPLGEEKQYIYTFPKNKLNQELEMGYVTDKLDKEVLKVQMNRIYNKLKEEYLYLYNENEDYYKDNLNKINNCIPPVENTKNYMLNSKVTKK